MIRHRQPANPMLMTISLLYTEVHALLYAFKLIVYMFVLLLLYCFALEPYAFSHSACRFNLKLVHIYFVINQNGLS